MAVFDGDDAGQRSVRALQQYFGQKNLQFQPNREYVSVRNGFAIEGLFPDTWIIEVHANHSSWFDAFSVDASNALEYFGAKDGHKNSLIDYLIQRAEKSNDAEWSRRWVRFLDSIESSLARQNAALASAATARNIAAK